MTGAVAPELLQRLLHPPAVTIIGASPNGHLTEHLLGNLQRRALRFHGPVRLVNPNYHRLFDLPCVAAPGDVDGEPGLVYLHVRPDACLPALRSLPRLPSGVVLFPDASREPGGYEDEIANWGREHGVGVLGPQSNGLVSTGGRLHGLLIPVAEDLEPGPIAVLAQSGGVLGGIVKRFGERGVGIHSGLEYGTECMLTAPALGLALLELPPVRALALHADGVSSLPELARLLERGQALGKPVVLLIAGSSNVGQRAAASHSGAAATPRRVLKGLADQYGALLVGSLDELAWSLEALEEVEFERPAGPRVAIFSDSGGSGIVLADVVEAHGVPVLEPGPDVRAKLGGRFGGTLNPFDFGSAEMGHLTAQSDDVRTVASDPRYGIFAFATPLGLAVAEHSVHVEQLDEFSTTVSALGRVPVIAGLVPLRAADRPQGRHAVLALGSLESAIKIRALSRWAGSASPEREGAEPAADRMPAPDPGDREEEIEVLTGERAVRELESLPLTWPAQTWVGGPEQLDPRAIPFPVVVKTEAGLAHRAREGGVLTGVSTERDLRNAVAYLLERFAGPVSVSEQVTHEDDFFLGAVREHGLTLLLFGAGGEEAERAEVRVAPIDAEAARELARARAPELSEPLVTLVLEFQRWLLARPWVRAVDCNPIVPRKGRLVALDVKIHGTPPK